MTGKGEVITSPGEPDTLPVPSGPPRRDPLSPLESPVGDPETFTSRNERRTEEVSCLLQRRRLAG